VQNLKRLHDNNWDLWPWTRTKWRYPWFLQDSAVNNINKKDYITTTDLNVKIQSNAIKDVMGNNEENVQNNNAKCLINSVSHCRHKEIHKCTWSTTTGTLCVWEYVLINQELELLVHDTRVHRRATICLDHSTFLNKINVLTG